MHNVLQAAYLWVGEETLQSNYNLQIRFYKPENLQTIITLTHILSASHDPLFLIFFLHLGILSGMSIYVLYDIFA